jgi:hypothetical protein
MFKKDFFGKCASIQFTVAVDGDYPGGSLVSEAVMVPLLRLDVCMKRSELNRKI